MFGTIIAHVNELKAVKVRIAENGFVWISSPGPALSRSVGSHTEASTQQPVPRPIPTNASLAGAVHVLHAFFSPSKLASNLNLRYHAHHSWSNAGGTGASSISAQGSLQAFEFDQSGNPIVAFKDKNDRMPYAPFFSPTQTNTTIQWPTSNFHTWRGASSQ
jgi:hypothetical protein